MFDTVVALGTVALQIFIVVVIVAWIVKAPVVAWVARKSPLVLRLVFTGAALGSFIYQYGFGFEPCILCWYQRIAIFSIAILSFTGSVVKSALVRLQVLIFSSIGLAVSLFHNYITIFPNSGVDVCGTTGPSCTVLYVYQFGYITIPMMSLTVLLLGVILSVIAGRFPQAPVVALEK